MTQQASSTPAESGSVIYLYGVARGDGITPPVEGIVPGATVELLPVGDLVAVLSRTPGDAFAPGGEVTSGGNAWTIERALAHHRVLASIAPQCTVAPMKFGAICHDLPDVVELLTRGGAQFKLALDRVADASEWSVKLYADMEACRAMTEQAPAIAPLKAELAEASPGKAFFIRKKLRDAVEHEVRRRVAARAEGVHGELTAGAREAASGRQRQQPGKTRDGRTLMLIAGTAYLVEKQGEERFRQTVTRLTETLSAEGVVLELTGPWPPYSFASLNADIQRG
jgi:hypothetical protein